MVIKSSVICFFILIASMLMLGVANAGDPMKGRGVYAERCAGCHGVNGVPQVPAIPNFTLGQGLMKSDQQLVAFIEKGKSVMPGFKGVLSDQEIRDVIAHIRTFF